jgi:hypothetical protein
MMVQFNFGLEFAPATARDLSFMFHLLDGLAYSPTSTASIFLTLNIPSITRPNTTCLPSKNGVGTVVMKN